MGYSGEPIPWMIEAAAFLSVVIQRWEYFAIIFTLLILNAVVGFWQELKADNAIALLKKRLALKARVLRDSAWREIPAKILFLTTESTQVVGTLIAVYGVFMTPIGWELAGFVWGYALLSFIITTS